MTALKGTGASKGIAIGKVFVKEEINRVIEKETAESVDIELERVERAQQEAMHQLGMLKDHTVKNIGEDEALIFEVQQAMLQDKDFINRINGIIREEKVKAEYAVHCTKEEYVSLFAGIEDPYLRERSVDIMDVSKRLIDSLTEIKEKSLADIDEPVIIVANDLLPSDTARIDKKYILGIITQEGGEMSHTSILARIMQIPAVVGVTGVLSNINHGDEVIVDGEGGHIIINPDRSVKAWWLERLREHKIRLEGLQHLKGTKSITTDGVRVRVNANIGTPDDVDNVIDNDAEGIGLFRSEFLYMHSKTMPDEETQLEVYKTVLESMKDKPVIIRTLDVGGDKEISYLQIPKEENPFLGYRGIRVSLDKPDIFKTQLRALFRASIYGRLGIMFPMISTLEELKKAKQTIEEVKNELRNENIPFSPDVAVGIMIETPAAAMISDILAKEVDFFSIGTNDLTQYTIAVDRMNAKVSHLYNAHHPAVLRLIQTTINNGHRENIWVGICGEAAADITLTETFVAMGIDELSVNAGSILEIRDKVQRINAKEAQIRLQI